GLTGYHTLLMIDGIRLNNATFRSGPNQYLNTLDPLILSNIEIIRSSGSVQYGSDALGGTVHFFTKTPQFSTTGKVLIEPHVIAKYVCQGVNGINNTLSNTLFPGMERIIRSETTVAGKNIAFYGGVGYKKFNDIDASASLGTLKPTGYDEYDTDAKLLIKKDKHNFIAAFQMVKQNNVPLYHKVVMGTYSIYVFDPQFRSLAYLKHDFLIDHKWARKISTTLYTQHSVEERHKQITGETEQTIESDKVRSIGTTIDIFSAPKKFWTFNSGLDINFDKVNSSTKIASHENTEIQYYRGLYPDNATAWNMALFSLHQINLNRFVLNAGLRFNKFHIATLDTLFGNTCLTPSALVGNIGLSYKINNKIRIVSTLNTGFRAPNINDVSSFGIADFRYEIPGYDLKSEKSISYEVGYRQKSSRVSSSFSLFKTNLTNLITNVPTSYQGQDSVLIDVDNNEYIQYYRKENTNKAYIWGFEAETEIQLLRWLNSYGRLYYTFGQDHFKNEPLRRIPPVNGVIGLNLYLGESTHIRTGYLFAGKQDRLSGGDISDNRIPDGGTPGWSIINISIGYTGLHWIDINMGINNLFDTAYRTHGSGVDGYGRNIWLGIKLSI
ncbi:MAG: TonB-dependent receptor, partial [Bacteroidales bacterium]|nr:TonB-dependent receptor [Bacteroidales bacterium]